LNIIWYVLLLGGLTVLFSLLIGSILKSRKDNPERFDDKIEIGGNICPICGSRLKKGEKIHSVVFTGNKNSLEDVGSIGSGDRIVYIYGCPYCYPVKAGVKRICPVCKKEIPNNGYLIGRMWNRRGKIHLHIQGCTLCSVNTIKK